jgi:hypothetical protein
MDRVSSDSNPSLLALRRDLETVLRPMSSLTPRLHSEKGLYCSRDFGGEIQGAGLTISLRFLFLPATSLQTGNFV